MLLLDKKSKEQERWIQSIKVDMKNLNKSFKDKAEELENQRVKLVLAQK
jgi:hypothetical protein